MTAKEKPVCQRALAALKVAKLDERISSWLKYNDPQALKQIEKAIADMEAIGVKSNPRAR